MVKLLDSKLNTIVSISDNLIKDSFLTSQSSGAIKTIDNDDLYNNVIGAYGRIADWKASLSVIKANLKFRITTVETEIRLNGNINENDAVKLKSSINNAFTNNKNYLATTMSKTNLAISNVNVRLNALGVFEQEKSADKN